jgi:hypothetical protein
MTPKESTCSSCGARIYWAVTAAGKRIPIDVDPTLMGLFFLVCRPDHLLAVSAAAEGPVAEKYRLARANRYDSHFATCPDAAKHRKLKRRLDDET